MNSRDLKPLLQLAQEIKDLSATWDRELQGKITALGDSNIDEAIACEKRMTEAWNFRSTKAEWLADSVIRMARIDPSAFQIPAPDAAPNPVKAIGFNPNNCMIMPRPYVGIEQYPLDHHGWDNLRAALFDEPELPQDETITGAPDDDLIGAVGPEHLDDEVNHGY